MTDARTAWGPAHFIGRHPALDLVNTVFDRRVPADDNELLRSPRDLADWLRASGLTDDGQAHWVAEHADVGLVATVHRIREASFAVFDALAGGREPEPEPLGLLMSAAAAGLRAGAVAVRAAEPIANVEWREPLVVPTVLALLSVNAFYTLPRERIRSCRRCGWLFVDTSRGGRRRWCSMQTCGNREKVSRHRGRPG